MKLSQAALLLLATSLLSGCQATNSPASSAWSWNPLSRMISKPTPQPTRIVAIWSPDVLNTQGQVSTQGFGGRLYFYDAENKTIPVDGQLIIHGYDDSNITDSGNTTPDKKFVFTAEQLKQHHGECEFGSSYSIWLPWQPVGGMQRQISLVPTFSSSTGTRLVGNQTQNLLPGKKTAVPTALQKQYSRQASPPVSQYPSGTRQGTVAPTAYPQQEAGVSTARTLDYTTTTINVPRSMSQQMRSTTGSPTGLLTNPTYQRPQPGTTPNRASYDQSSPIAKPATLQNGRTPTVNYRPAWVAPGTPLTRPASRRPALSTATAVSPQAP
ncbi:MAG TPA: hypothetical protein EYN70_13610 [Planctomycetaceae bacterium]|nr:hypothetical protein [Planctomycetaceae bacterium]